MSPYLLRAKFIITFLPIFVIKSRSISSYAHLPITIVFSIKYKIKYITYIINIDLSITILLNLNNIFDIVYLNIYFSIKAHWKKMIERSIPKKQL